MTIGIDIRRCQQIARSETSAWSIFVSKRLNLARRACRKLPPPASQPRSCCPLACRWHRHGKQVTKEPHEPFGSSWLSRNFFLGRAAHLLCLGMAAGALWLPMRTESKSSTSRVMTDEKDKTVGMARHANLRVRTLRVCEPFPSRVRTRSPLFCWARPEPKAKRNHQAPERGTEFRHKSLLNSPIQQISSALWWIHCCFMLPVSSMQLSRCCYSTCRYL